MDIVPATYKKLFTEQFGSGDRMLIVKSPGRVNFIGEHTDYNEGFVLPAAIDKVMVFVVRPRNDRRCRLYAIDLKEGFECSLESLLPTEKVWPNYLMGVIDQYRRAGFAPGGFDCAFGGNIPIGAGMSSSAAIEGGLAYALNELFDLGIDRLTMVKLAQKAENEFVGVQCGIMDQFINIFGKEKRVVRIDCRTLQHEYLPFVRDDLRIVLCDTQVRRALASSEYNVRRKQCEEGVAVLRTYDPSVRSLRDATEGLLMKHRRQLAPVVYKRCRYVVQENLRVEKACQDLRQNDVTSFGQRMLESHDGLKHEYEVSSVELDALVEIASRLPGVYGSRMMGAGFGGCTINIVDNARLDEFKNEVGERYRSRTGKEPRFYVSKIQSGTIAITQEAVHA